MSRLCLVLLALACSASRATADEIRLFSGKPLRNVSVRDETYEKVVYRPEGLRADQTIDASKVKEVVYAATSEGYALAMDKMAQGDYRGARMLFQAAAGDPPRRQEWVKQYSLFNAAECSRLAGNFDEAIKDYDKLIAEVPETKFYGESVLRKVQCLEAKKDLDGARKTLEALKSAGVGERWSMMADYHLIRLGSNSKAFDEYVALQGRAAGAGYADVANLARLGVGYALIDQKKLGEARKYFEDIIDDRQASPTPVVAGAYNGLGTCYVSQDSPSQDDWDKALFAFLRTVFYYGDELGQSERVAEALYWAGRAFEQRAGDPEVNQQRARFMYTRCVKEFPSSSWAALASER